MKEFLSLYKKDFDITRGTKMETFPGMVVEQSGKSIKIHLDNYVKDVVAEYAAFIKKALRPKKVLITPGSAFKDKDDPELPIHSSRSTTTRLWQRFSLQQHGSDSTFRLRCHCWHAIAHRPGQLNGRRSTI